MDKKIRREIIYNTVPELNNDLMEIRVGGIRYIISPFLKKRLIFKNISLFLEIVVLTFIYNGFMDCRFDIPINLATNHDWKMGIIYSLGFLLACGMVFFLTTRILLPRDLRSEIITVDEFMEDKNGDF